MANDHMKILSHPGHPLATVGTPILMMLTLAENRAKICPQFYAILTSLLFDLQTSVRGQNGVEFRQESTGQIFPSPLIG